jgi:hypothetical protein
MSNSPGILAPLVALIAWSLVVWVALYATRLPAMRRQRVRPEAGRFAGELAALMPARARQVADNYNHLMEQPTIFYATGLVLWLLGQGTAAQVVALAWGYVGLRIVHSLVQVSTNHVPTRFAVFVLSTLALAGLVAEAVRAVC